MYGVMRRGVPHTSLTLIARVLYGVVVWAPGRIGCLCNGLYAVLSSGIAFRASYSKMKMYMYNVMANIIIVPGNYM